LGNSRGSGAAAEFDPLTLFESGEDGAFLQAGDLSTMFTDLAGTNPATVGDPVALWVDGSGNGNDATQSVVASRMVISGSGPYYLDPDGGDDNFGIPLGAGFTGDFALILNTGVIFGSIDTGVNTSWGYTVTPAYIPDGNIHALIVLDRALTTSEKSRIASHYSAAVTSQPATAVNAFRSRTDLTTLDTSYGDWSSVTSAAQTFYGCSAMTSPPDVSGWVLVTNASSAFFGCSAMTSPPDVSGWVLVENAAIAFRGCSSMASPPDVSGWVLVTNAAQTFYDCSAMASPPDVSGWVLVENAVSAFYGCSAMTSPPDVSGWVLVTNVESAFRGCSGLTMPIDLTGINPTILTAGTNMMTGISLAGYDQISHDAALIAWDAAYDLTTVNALTIHFGSAKYTPGGAAETARSTLVANGWIIIDGGPGAALVIPSWITAASQTVTGGEDLTITLDATDGDTYSIVGGSSAGLFEIVSGSTLQLITQPAADYPASAYEVIVRATETTTGGTADRTFTIAVEAAVDAFRIDPTSLYFLAPGAGDMSLDVTAPARLAAGSPYDVTESEVAAAGGMAVLGQPQVLETGPYTDGTTLNARSGPIAFDAAIGDPLVRYEWKRLGVELVGSSDSYEKASADDVGLVLEQYTYFKGIADPVVQTNEVILSTPFVTPYTYPQSARMTSVSPLYAGSPTRMVVAMSCKVGTQGYIAETIGIGSGINFQYAGGQMLIGRGVNQANSRADLPVSAGAECNVILAVEGGVGSYMYLQTNDGSENWVGEFAAHALSPSSTQIALFGNSFGGSSYWNGGFRQLTIWHNLPGALPDITDLNVRRFFFKADLSPQPIVLTDSICGSPAIRLYGNAATIAAGTHDGSSGSFTLNAGSISDTP